jgi:glycogen debranching enzyme
MNQNPEGLLESLQLNPRGQNIIQSWKDSLDSHSHADGSLANFTLGITSIEVQALAHDALRDAADLLGRPEFEQQAERLKQTILENFWITDQQGRFFAMGSDRDENGSVRLLDVRASNMGHLLNSRLLDGDDLASYREAIVRAIFAPEMLSRAGIRTLASNENRYRPHSYHNGSVWPWDTFWISLGLLRHGKPSASPSSSAATTPGPSFPAV